MQAFLFGGVVCMAAFSRFGAGEMELTENGWSSEQAAGDPSVPARAEHLVVIGNGMAGCRAIEELLARDAGRYRVTIDRVMYGSINGGGPEYSFTTLNGKILLRQKK